MESNRMLQLCEKITNETEGILSVIPCFGYDFAVSGYSSSNIYLRIEAIPNPFESLENRYSEDICEISVIPYVPIDDDSLGVVLHYDFEPSLDDLKKICLSDIPHVKKMAQAALKLSQEHLSVTIRECFEASEELSRRAYILNYQECLEQLKPDNPKEEIERLSEIYWKTKSAESKQQLIDYIDEFIEEHHLWENRDAVHCIHSYVTDKDLRDNLNTTYGYLTNLEKQPDINKNEYDEEPAQAIDGMKM